MAIFSELNKEQRLLRKGKGFYESRDLVNNLSTELVYYPYIMQPSKLTSAIAEGFAEASSVFIVITSAKILPGWLFPSKIYIQFKIFIFLDIIIVYKQEISLPCAREVSIHATRRHIYYISSAVYSSPFSFVFKFFLPSYIFQV